ncbi:MAG: bifunctional oligoribonuclease/PAP phosphatase NrnA [Selenomonadaceae bacterium]|nr:bifunctional oligoribonuclease/PAP phosphatase NrnA [Selenomonadaceae bacterium]
MIELKEAAKILKAAKKIAITAHTNPDGDAIGSTLAMMRALKNAGKEAFVLIDDELPRHLSCLPGFNEIIRPNETDKITADILLVLDTATDRIGCVEKIVSAKILNIDHHVTNKGEHEATYVDATAAATAEIVFDLLKLMEVPLDIDIANCLYLGMATDTGFFKYANTKSRTLKAAADCLDAGVRPNEISEFTEQKSFETVHTMVLALNTIELFANGKAAGIFLDEELTNKAETTEGFIDQIRIIEGVDIAVLLKCKKAGECRVSMRSKGKDVAKIAESFGGGGHVRAAGATLKLPFEEAKRTIIDAITKALED